MLIEGRGYTLTFVVFVQGVLTLGVQVSEHLALDVALTEKEKRGSVLGLYV